MAYAYVGSANNYDTSGATNLAASYSPTVGNTLIVAAVTEATTGISDGHNTYNAVGSTNAFGSSYVTVVEANVTTGGSLSIASSATTLGIYVVEYSGLATSALISGSFESAAQGSPGAGANVLATTTEPDVTSVPAMLWEFIVDVQSANGGTNPAPTVGTTTAFTSRTVGWVGGSSNQSAVAGDTRITSSGSYHATGGVNSSSQYDNFFIVAAAFVEGSASGPSNQSLPLTGVALAPLAWVIRRRQIRARERNAQLRHWKRDESSGLILPDYKKVA